MFVVIMAGGSGTRFWPASRERLPKQFLKVFSDKTMIEETVERVRDCADRICIVTSRTHREKIESLFGEDLWIITEPFGRNTAACIGLAATHIVQRYGNVPIVCLPADHFVADKEKFIECLKKGSELSTQGLIVTLGIVPTRPETGYGYIERDEPIDSDSKTYKVKRFVEKPCLEDAVRFVSSGNYFWNSGIFIFTTDVILSEMKFLMPELHSGLEEIRKSIDTDKYDEVVESIYSRLRSVSIDYGVMEKTLRPIYVLESDFGWSDVGSWLALYELRKDKDDSENLVLADALLLDSRKNLVYSDSNRLTCLLGVEGLAVVDTPDVLLVMDLKRSQEVKRFPEILKETNKKNFY
ncbi:MAG: sugar phosphate nucleotidyltransferase [Pyrinomonadaceae bacterium]|nr:sugar phosphate nucleotidyltransferase [Pyrinomonadaceae bacterium]MCX7640971.1 sugar phosphate nucleotidyltransferase [Pyrinomonadaceae bacterium]MDW8305106.1 mannose-1-phosphate guanylyltransferase [Acidobacteriota bacterium]